MAKILEKTAPPHNARGGGKLVEKARTSEKDIHAPMVAGDDTDDVSAPLAILAKLNERKRQGRNPRRVWEYGVPDEYIEKW